LKPNFRIIHDIK